MASVFIKFTNYGDLEKLLLIRSGEARYKFIIQTLLLFLFVD